MPSTISAQGNAAWASQSTMRHTAPGRPNPETFSKAPSNNPMINGLARFFSSATGRTRSPEPKAV